jgi:hypothetical protein
MPGFRTLAEWFLSQQSPSPVLFFSEAGSGFIVFVCVTPNKRHTVKVRQRVFQLCFLLFSFVVSKGGVVRFEPV